ncbi:hypothetical protein AHAS_Ahas03G0195400 [Arachis hypogaea]
MHSNLFCSYCFKNVLQGDRIHATISKPVLEGVRHQIKEYAIYSMRNFIVKTNNDKVRTNPHKYKLSFYTKTEVILQPIETFTFNPFKFCLLLNLSQKVPLMKIYCLIT